MVENNRRFATMTSKAQPPPNLYFFLLQRPFGILLETVCTKLMRGLKVSYEALFNTGKNSRSELFKFVAFFFLAPIFKAHTFLFEFVYFRRELRLFLLGGESNIVGLQQLDIDLRNGGYDLVIIRKVVVRLEKIHQSLDTLRCHQKFVNHVLAPNDPKLSDSRSSSLRRMVRHFVHCR